MQAGGSLGGGRQAGGPGATSHPRDRGLGVTQPGPAVVPLPRGRRDARQQSPPGGAFLLSRCLALAGNGLLFCLQAWGGLRGRLLLARCRQEESQRLPEDIDIDAAQAAKALQLGRGDTCQTGRGGSGGDPTDNGKPPQRWQQQDRTQYVSWWRSHSCLWLSPPRAASFGVSPSACAICAGGKRTWRQRLR